MPVLLPRTLDAATTMLADEPDATLLCGGTDLMVEVNDGHRRPEHAVVVVNRIAELRAWRHDPVAGTVTIGAAVTYTELMREPLATLLPALAEASRTVGSPQIRNAGTLGGNLGTCSPAGDGLPVLAAADATLTLASASGMRTVGVVDFMRGVKRTDLRPGELITSITVPVAAGWQGYAKVGVRNAMVIAVASACLVVDDDRRRIGLALGSVGPTVLRCPRAEAWLAERIDWEAGRLDDGETTEGFGELAASECAPISDHRATADYRRHAVTVMARRLARRAFSGVDDPAAVPGGGDAS